ncbi:hypothetical protein ELH53_17800 [Rhizobium ruizarguesonis]|uniref:hypothetical protein n=1 Tax=Rhizobium ruizarguesonis TaxID=2081791 RepID=UPI001030F596|nr:hypothetical protein [Rhizobium ruizarguesonis]TAV07879.1 hypothetical protein ELI39_22635 [Rhizobium ruizarguesonis]TAZ97184.1 hypothetical protein ELH67_22705 [Rhizobium ruizarguesonis]TBA40070.1 hypothetical protein ELH60_23000 [Rhizobium ruizarguesonis]TBA82801.1 hypothetical protein ELH56_22260 [Rhizobium ruizarguesonis]TBA86702.1 hypothetical protein ELH53_17800 [Rhizobium ruizarguesonis]
MFFLGGMTMGYLDPPVRAGRREQISASIPPEKDRRLIETSSNPPQNESAVERSLIWAWRTLC